ncbi:MAG: hypothetical protein KC425_04450 [Anaerolineales bacterium]|nr:hypothetical protein [Anaerolineales bacterium]
MKLLSILLAVILVIFGFIFIAGSQGQVIRIVVGVVLLIAGGAFIALDRLRPQPSQTTIVQKIDLSGDVNLESIRCQNCDSPLDKDSIEVKAGAIFVNCPYCGTSYQFEEAPKW